MQGRTVGDFGGAYSGPSKRVLMINCLTSGPLGDGPS